jgi:hypothetical protein
VERGSLPSKSLGVWGKGGTILDDNGIESGRPPICLFVFSIEDRGGAAFLRGIEDDEASLLSDAPKLQNLLLKSPGGG